MSLSTLIYLGCLSFSFIMTKHRWDLPQGSFATHWSSQKISCWWKEETVEVKTGCYFPWKKAELPQSDNSTCICTFWRHPALSKSHKHTQRRPWMMWEGSFCTQGCARAGWQDNLMKHSFACRWIPATVKQQFYMLCGCFKAPALRHHTPQQWH